MWKVNKSPLLLYLIEEYLLARRSSFTLNSRSFFYQQPGSEVHYLRVRLVKSDIWFLTSSSYGTYAGVSWANENIGSHMRYPSLETPPIVSIVLVLCVT